MSDSIESERRQAADDFAVALDRSDFAAARQFLAADCVYACRGQQYAGADAIVAQYRQADEWGRRNLDEIVYESSVRLEADGQIRLAFVDHLRRGAARHIFRCEQVLRFNAQYLVERIEHVDLPGEREGLDEFLAFCGLSRE